MGHSNSARQQSRRGRRRGRGRESAAERESAEFAKLLIKFFVCQRCHNSASSRNKSDGNNANLPLPFPSYYSACPSGKQTNKFLPFPLSTHTAMDHRQQQQRQRQRHSSPRRSKSSSPAALHAGNGLQLQRGIMLCIFDMAQTAADPLYRSTPSRDTPARAPTCEAHNGKTIFVLKITKLMASFRLLPVPPLASTNTMSPTHTHTHPHTHRHSSRVRVCYRKQATRGRGVARRLDMAVAGAVNGWAGWWVLATFPARVLGQLVMATVKAKQNKQIN